MHQLFLFAFQKVVYRNPCPFGDDCCDISLRHFLFKHLPVFLNISQLRIFCDKILFQLSYAAVSNLCHFAEITCPLGLLLSNPCLINLLLYFSNLLDDIFFQHPVSLHTAQLLIDIRQFGLNGIQPLFGSSILFLLQGLTLNLQFNPMSIHFIYFSRHTVNLNAKL